MLLIPDPNGDQLLPSQRAILPAGLPPAVVNEPAAYSVPPDTASVYTLLFIPEPTPDQLLPFHCAMLLAALLAQLWNRLSNEGVVELLLGLAVAPLLSAYFAGTGAKAKNRLVVWFDRLQDRTDALYAKVLTFSVNRPVTIIGVTSLVFSGILVAWAGGFGLIWLYHQGWFLDFSVFGTNMRDYDQRFVPYGSGAEALPHMGQVRAGNVTGLAAGLPHRFPQAGYKIREVRLLIRRNISCYHVLKRSAEDGDNTEPCNVTEEIA